MTQLFDAFWRAVVYCMHPRVIGLSFLPLVLMVALMLTDEIPNPIAAIIACLLMGKFRCINAESA